MKQLSVPPSSCPHAISLCSHATLISLGHKNRNGSAVCGLWLQRKLSTSQINKEGGHRDIKKNWHTNLHAQRQKKKIQYIAWGQTAMKMSLANNNWQGILIAETRECHPIYLPYLLLLLGVFFLLSWPLTERLDRKCQSINKYMRNNALFLLVMLFDCNIKKKIILLGGKWEKIDVQYLQHNIIGSSTWKFIYSIFAE